MISRKLLLATTAFAVAIGAQPAFAQESSESASSYGDIIVTARKRQESVIKVPVVENVITAQALETYQINNLQDITTKIPGLVSGDAVLAIGTQMSLRGVGSNSLDQGVDQSVSLNVDGLQLSHGLAYRAASFDLAQVEVLKGPQALYFGKNSTAGVISFRSADPGDELEVKAKLGYEFEARERRGELVLSTPVTDTFGVRLATMYSNSKGIFTNPATALPGLGGKDPKYKRFGGGELFLVRATALWKPVEEFTARLKVNIGRDRMRQGSMTQVMSCPDGKGNVPGFNFSFYHPNEDCKYDKKLFMVDLDPAAFPGIRNNGVPFLDLNQDFGSLELTYDISKEISLTSVTGYYKSHADTMMNGTSTGYAGPAISADNIFKRREITQEFRLDTDFTDSPLNFTAGAFYQDGKVSNDFTLGGNRAIRLSNIGVPGVPGDPPVLAATLVKGLSKFDINSISMFGQARYKASEQLEIAGGVRWTHEKRDLFVFNRLTNLRTVLAPGSDKLSSKNWSPELTLTYTPNDDLTIFAALKQAYKSGSFNIVIPGNTGENKSFGDEKVRGGEVGLKTRTADRSLSFDLAAYYYRYSGLQTGVNEPAQNGLPVLRTVNAGKAEIYGIDFEAHYRPPSIENLTLNLAGAWNKTKFLELNNVPCYGGQLVSQGCDQFLNPNTGRFTGQNLKGVPFVRAPEWIINFGFDYEMAVGEDMRLVLANDNRYASSFLVILGDPKVRPNTIEPKALTIDASLTLYGPDDKWSISVAGKNLTDKLRPGYGSSYNYTGASIFGAPIAGGTAVNASGVDEQGRSQALGRAISVTLGLKY